ncbi:MAG: type IV pilus assembly protein PilM [Firmicutes bacterium]|nr:type IV pilus assembly protein PilM [Bacillota bacterium]
MFSRLPGIGLDIGYHKIRLIWVEKKEAGLQLIKYGSIQTPPGTVEGGYIVEPERLGEEIKGLVKELKIGGRRVVSAVGGQQSYIRNLLMPSFAWEELKTAVYYQAMKFLPIPLEEAAIDIFPLREIELETGKQTELFFLAVRKQQVENLKITCCKAGLKLAVVELEALALYRVINEASETVVALLSMGFYRSHITVFAQGVPVFHRPIDMGSSAFYAPRSMAGGNSSRWGEASMLEEKGGDYLQTDLIRELKGAMEDFELQNEKEGESIERLWLCGGGNIGGWEFVLGEALGLQVETVDILPRLILPGHFNRVEKRELQTDYQVALGLAAREVF